MAYSMMYGIKMCNMLYSINLNLNWVEFMTRDALDYNYERKK